LVWDGVGLKQLKGKRAMILDDLVREREISIFITLDVYSWIIMLGDGLRMWMFEPKALKVVKGFLYVLCTYTSHSRACVCWAYTESIFFARKFPPVRNHDEFWFFDAFLLLPCFFRNQCFDLGAKRKRWNTSIKTR